MSDARGTDAPASSALPIKGGFFLRGHNATRIEAFCDAAFAFAVTLLVIAFDQVPTTYDQLIAALREVPAFAMAFVLLMLFWSGHWKWSRRFGLDDTPSLLLSFSLIFLILCYVYPLKYLSTLFVYWVSGGAMATSARLNSIEELYGIFAIYGIGFVLMSLCIALLNAWAYRKRDEIGLNSRERFLLKSEIGAWIILICVGLLSTMLALFVPPSPFVVPGWAYMLLAIVMPIYGVTTGRRERAFT